MNGSSNCISFFFFWPDELSPDIEFSDGGSLVLESGPEEAFYMWSG